jgi:hypothetical protein
VVVVAEAETVAAAMAETVGSHINLK